MERYSTENVQDVDDGKITLAITNDNTLVETPNVLSTACSETITATLEEGMDPSLLTWSASNENVTISGSGTTVTLTGVADGETDIIANYNNGQYRKVMRVQTKNKWRQRGLTTEYVEFDATYEGSVGANNQSMSFNSDGSLSALSGGLTSDQVDQTIANTGDPNAGLWLTVTSDSLILEFPSRPSANQTYQFTAEGIDVTYQDETGTLVKQ